MDFAFLPPEINSTRMYAGPGSGSLLAAAGSWDSLSAELGITAETYESILSCLTSLYWRGPAAQSMSATAAPYIGWLHTTSEQTMQMAMQARAAAAAYELAHAMTVPPLAVAANRTQLASLVATNFFGQNTPAIAQTEAQYGEYWAQDAAAMYGYAAGAAAATQLPTFSSPQQTTNPAGLTDQNAAVTAANTSATASVSQTVAAAPTAAADPIIPFDLTLQDGFLLAFASTDSITNIEEFAQETIGSANDLRILPRGGGDAAGRPRPGDPRGAPTQRRRLEPCRRGRPGRRDRHSGPRGHDREDVGAGELDRTVRRPDDVVIGRRRTGPRRDRRARGVRVRVRYGGRARDPGGDGLASHGRRPPLRRPSHGDGATTGGGVTGR